MKNISQKTLLVTLLLILCTGILVIASSIKKNQTINSHAGGGQTIDHLLLAYPTATMIPNEPPMYMSAQAVDVNNQLVDGATYMWSISSPVSLGRLIETNQNITGFQPMNLGSGDITITAIKDGKTITKSFRMSVVDHAASVSINNNPIIRA